MATTFSHPKNWTCIDALWAKYPRGVGLSKVLRIAVEDQLARLNKKSNQTIESFVDKYAFDLESDVKVWKMAIKSMSAIEISELAKLLKKREGLVTDELIKRAH